MTTYALLALCLAVSAFAFAALAPGVLQVAGIAFLVAAYGLCAADLIDELRRHLASFDEPEQDEEAQDCPNELRVGKISAGVIAAEPALSTRTEHEWSDQLARADRLDAEYISADELGAADAVAGLRAQTAAHVTARHRADSA